MEGVDELLSALQRYTKEPKYPEAFSAQVYKIARGEKDERLTFLKVTGGTLAVKQVLRGEDWEEKADQLRLYSGSKFTLLQAAPAGTICAVMGLTKTQAGEHLGSGKGVAAPVLEPVLEYRMHVDTDNVQGAYLKLRRLEEEDPQLHLLWDHQLREIRVQLMGAVQMEILQKLIQNRFDLSVSFDEGNIVYKETIVAPVAVSYTHLDVYKRQILGCTELPIVADSLPVEGPFIDPTAELAKAAIRFCGYETTQD